MSETASSVGTWIVVVAFVFFVSIFLVGLWSSRAPPLSAARIRELLGEAVDQPLPAAGLNVPLALAMSSASGLSAIAFGKNSINPLLQLHPQHVVVRVLRRREVPYREIRSVGLQETIASPSVILHFSNGDCFIARPLSEAWRIRLLRLLQARGIALEHGAARYLEGLLAQAQVDHGPD